MSQDVRPRETLTREKVLSAGLDLVERSGVEALSMRKLAAEVGVEAMSLYNHVANKDAVLDGITDLVLGRVDIPASTSDWQQDIRNLADAFRAAALAYPRTTPLVLTRQLQSKSALPVTEAALATVRRAGFGPEESVHAMRAVLALLVGTLLREVGSGPTFSGADLAGSRKREAVLASSGLGRIAESSRFLAVCDHQREYEFGLELIIGGLAARRP